MAFNGEQRVITCCKDCQERYPACHGHCEKYIQQRAEYDAAKAEYMKQVKVQRGLNESLNDTMYKYTKRINCRSKYRKWK